MAVECSVRGGLGLPREGANRSQIMPLACGEPSPARVVPILEAEPMPAAGWKGGSVPMDAFGEVICVPIGCSDMFGRDAEVAPPRPPI